MKQQLYGEVISVSDEELILKNSKSKLIYMKRDEVGGRESKGKCESLLGIDISYVLISTEDNKQYGSRKVAMAEILEKEKSFLIKGAKKKARIHKILDRALIVDCCGIETLIPVERCTSIYTNSLLNLSEFELGKDINVEVLSYKEENLELEVEKLPINIDFYKANNQYVGIISALKDKNVYVTLPIGNVVMMCRNPNWKRALQNGDKVKCTIERINEDEKRLWGFIGSYVKRGTSN